jgi:hypothetical protein
LNSIGCGSCFSHLISGSAIIFSKRICITHNISSAASCFIRCFLKDFQLLRQGLHFILVILGPTV